MIITEEDTTAWLENYRQGWVNRDVNQILALFTPDVEYHERRFGDPLCNYDSLEDYWRARVGINQREVVFEFQLWAVKNDECFSSFQARFIWLPINGIIELDGVCRARFVRSEDRDLLCCKFEEWMDHRES